MLFAVPARSVNLPIAVLACVAIAASAVRANTDLIAITGGALPGAPSVKFDAFTRASLNDAGQVAFVSTLQQGVGGVTSANDRAVVRSTTAGGATVARTGQSSLPVGGVLNSIQFTSLANDGAIVVSGQAAASEGVWRFPALQPVELLASTGGTAPGVPGATIADIGVSMLHSAGGVVAFQGDLQHGGSINSTSDRCQFLDDDGQQSLIFREGSTPPDVSGNLSGLNALAINDSGHAAMIGVLAVVPGGVTAGSSVGIWRMSPTGGALVAQRQSEGVADVPNASFSALGDPVINGSGAIAFRGELEPSASINETNRYGIWRDDDGVGRAVVRAGTQPVFLPAAQYANFSDPLLSDSGKILFTATLAAGVGGVGADNSQALVLQDEHSGLQLARTGSGGVPGVPGASFAAFGALAVNGNDRVALEGALATGAGGVVEANAKGIWLLSSNGAGQLVARAGDSLAGRTIADLSLTGSSGGSDGRLRSLNENNQLLFKASFTDGGEGLFLFTPPTASSPADFTGDGLVNGADLQRWRSNFGLQTAATRSQGDADVDGDVDGADLLLWQQQTGAAAAATAVPEPASLVLVLPAAVVGVLRLFGGGCPAGRRPRR